MPVPLKIWCGDMSKTQLDLWKLFLGANVCQTKSLDFFPIFLTNTLDKSSKKLNMGHVQDSPVATTMISNECMICHMKLHIITYNLGQICFSKSKIHISGPMSIKPPIV